MPVENSSSYELFYNFFIFYYAKFQILFYTYIHPRRNGGDERDLGSVLYLTQSNRMMIGLGSFPLAQKRWSKSTCRWNRDDPKHANTQMDLGLERDLWFRPKSDAWRKEGFFQSASTFNLTVLWGRLRVPQDGHSREGSLNDTLWLCCVPKQALQF